MIKMQRLFFYIRNKFLGPRKPLQVSFQTTTACNLACTYCYADAKNPRENELNTQEAKDLFWKLKKAKIGFLVLTGGEPLLRYDLEELVEFCAKIKLLTSIATNGVLLSAQKANRLKSLGLNFFHFSIDGSTEAIHSQVRGRGVFESSLKGLDNAVATGLPVTVQTILTRYNQEDLENIAVLLAEKKIKAWRLQLLVSCGRGKKVFAEQNFSAQEVMRLMERVYSLARKYKNKLEINFHALQFYKVFLYQRASSIREKLIFWFKGGCAVVSGVIIYINSDGSLRPCPHFPYTLPQVNVRKENIIDIYRKNPLLKKLRRKINLKGACRSCKYSFCCNGCRAQVFAETGDFFAADNNCPFKNN